MSGFVYPRRHTYPLMVGFQTPMQGGLTDGVRMMGGGPRTFPGGVTKWQWKEMQEKKQKQIERARLSKAKQIYERKCRSEVAVASPLLKPWQSGAPGASSRLPHWSIDPQVQSLADRFQKDGGQDLWTDDDGPEAAARCDARQSAHSRPGAAFQTASFSGQGAPYSYPVKRRVPTQADDMDTESAPLQQGGVLLQRKKQGDSSESGDSEGYGNHPDRPSPSHLSQTRFSAFDISPLSLKAIHEVMGFETMTVVQDATLPIILQGKDVLAKAKTGTGKTVAFLLPAIETIVKTSNPQGIPGGNPINVVVICPTRELANQAAAEAKMLMTFQCGLGVQVVIGGTNMNTETKRLATQSCQVLVGTPGRLLDHIQTNADVQKQLQGVKMLVLDEADQLLDMGFRKSLDGIIKVLPQHRQTLLFSATVPKEVHSMSQIALKKDHVFVDTVGQEDEETHAKVKQEYLIVPLEKQLGAVYSLLKKHATDDPDFKVLVFCTTARVTALMAELYKKLGFNTLEIHSRKSQAARTRVSDEFRKSKGGVIMFTSDVSARGVDYPDVSLVLQVHHQIKFLGLSRWGYPQDGSNTYTDWDEQDVPARKAKEYFLLMPWEEVFLRSIKDVSITQSPPILVAAAIEDKLRNGLQGLKDDVKEKAYQAWLGYYNSCGVLGWDKPTLVKRANLFSSSLGLNEPPALMRQTISMMGLRNVPGLRSI